MGMYRVWKLYMISLVMQTSQNNLGFSLCAVMSICHIVATSENWNEVQRELSANGGALPLNTRN